MLYLCHVNKIEVEIKEPEYIKSSGSEKDCPKPTVPEFAFIGRSNVGKSSLINMLCNRKDLAKTSSTPGKTRSINHFLMDKKWYIVDLPGYGYARVSKTERERFEGFISDYILDRDSLAMICVLIDSRISPQKIDLEFINWLGENHVPLAIVFTKTDKLKNSNEVNKNVDLFLKELSINWEQLPEYFVTSSVSKSGRKELLDYIGKVLESMKE